MAGDHARAPFSAAHAASLCYRRACGLASRRAPAADGPDPAGVGLAWPGLDPGAARVALVRDLLTATSGSAVLAGLVRLAARAVDAACGQLSLLAEQQVAMAVRCPDGGYSEQISALEDSLCTVTVLSGDVLVAADARTHPWLHDLAPVLSGAVGSYLGVPLLLADGTAVGALCVYDPRPRDWTDRDVALTCDVADVVALEFGRLLPT